MGFYTYSVVDCGDGLDLFKSSWMELTLPHENPSPSRAGSEFAQASALPCQRCTFITVLQVNGAEEQFQAYSGCLGETGTLRL